MVVQSELSDDEIDRVFHALAQATRRAGTMRQPRFTPAAATRISSAPRIEAIKPAAAFSSYSPSRRPP